MSLHPNSQFKMFRDLVFENPEYFNETNNTFDKFIESTKIKKNNFMYQKINKDGTYIKCNKSKNSTPFISCEWINNHVGSSLIQTTEESQTQQSKHNDTSIIPIIIKIVDEEHEYFSSKDLYNYNPHFFYATGATGGSRLRDVIKKYDIPDSDYCYAAHIKNKGWCKRDVTMDKATLMLSAEWVNINYWNSTNNIVNTKYEYAPNKIKMPNMFIDVATGSQMCIDVRSVINEDGTLDRKNTYFPVEDVSKCFKLESLHKVLIHKDGAFSENIHYKYMFCGARGFTDYESARTTRNKSPKMFLTWTGLVRVMYTKVPGNLNVDHFCDWANGILFTHKYGSKIEKLKMVLSSEELTAMLNCSASAVSCIYAINIGSVESLRSKYGIPTQVNDKWIVVKIGYTDNLTERMGAHKNEYGDDIRVSVYEYIDATQLKPAEAEIKRVLADKFVKNLIKMNESPQISFQPKYELIVIEDSKKEWGELKKVYSTIGANHSGRKLTEILNETRFLKEKNDVLSKLISSQDERIEELKYCLHNERERAKI